MDENVKDNDPLTLKRNLALAFKDIVQYIAHENTANPSVLDLITSCVDGVDAIFETLSNRFESLPESQDNLEPDYSAEDAQGNGGSLQKDIKLGTIILSKALDFNIPDGTDMELEPSNSSRWKAITTSFAEEINKARSAISENERIVYFMYIGMCLSSLEEMLSMVNHIMSDQEIRIWKKILLELRANSSKAARSVKPGKNAANARTFLRKLSECAAKLQERVKVKENVVSDMTKKVSLYFNRSK